MTDGSDTARLVALLEETGKAHHEAFAEARGEDPEWPIWYASYLHDKLGPYLAAPLTRSRLVFCLVETDDEHRAAHADEPWPDYYARRLLECLGPASAPADDKLALYHFDGCPFCLRVRRVIEELGVDVELRNIHEDQAHLAALREARGRTTVPVLRISSPGGEDRWMPESADIVRYLEATYREAAA
jgi:glutaredoxin